MSKDTTSGERQPLLEGVHPQSYGLDQPAIEVALPKPVNNPSKTELTLVVTALFSAVFLSAFDSTVVATLFTSMGSSFHRAHQASWLGSSYLLSVCCFTPLYGRLSDIMGRKGAMLLALSLFGSGTLLCGLAPSMNTLIAARAIAGMGGGGVMTVASITLSDLVPLAQRGIYQGIGNIVAGLGAGLGGPLGGLLGDKVGWRWAFFLQMPILLLVLVLTFSFVEVKLPEQHETTREKLVRIDYLGSVTLVMGVGSALLAVTMKAADERPWSDPLVLAFLVSSPLSISAFVYVEGWVSRQPIMPLQLLKQRTPLAVVVSNLCNQATMFAVLFNLPVFYTAVCLESSKSIGLHLLPLAVSMGLGSLGAGIIMKWSGKYYYLTLASGVLSVGSSALLLTWGPSTSPWHLWMDMFPAGLGGASMITTTLIALIASVDREDYAVATGLSLLFRTTGQVLGVSFSGALLQSLLTKNLHERITGPGAAEIIDKIRHSTSIIRTLDPPLRQAAVESYAASLRIVFLFPTGLAIVGFLACLPIEERPLPNTMREQAEQEQERRGERARNGESAIDSGRIPWKQPNIWPGVALSGMNARLALAPTSHFLESASHNVEQVELMSPGLQIQPPSAALSSLKSLNTSSGHHVDACVNLIQTIYHPELSRYEHRPQLARDFGPDLGYASNASGNHHATVSAHELRSDAFERSIAINWLTGLVGRGEDWIEAVWEEEEVKRRIEVIEDASTLLAAFAGSASKPTTQSIVLTGSSTRYSEGAQPARPISIVVHLQDAASTFLTEDHTSVGLRTWGASRLFAERLVNHPESFGLDMNYVVVPSPRRPLRILELGAGTGLISLALAKLLPRDTAQIFASDFHPRVLENLKANVRRNFVEHRHAAGSGGSGGNTPPVVVSLDWRELHDRRQRQEQCSDVEVLPLAPPFDTPFDWIIGADVVYEPAHALWIRSTVQHLLRHPCTTVTPIKSSISTSSQPSNTFMSSFHLIMPVRPTHDEETSSVPTLFPTRDAALRERGDGGKMDSVLAVCDIEEVKGMAETGHDQDIVRYLLYRIGWV
ncbi:hypothetical protein FRB96_006797 [Tulasnella sp. 330]|nr:hypothetical protein FRB96_006797 [Tulasnella sp. 330]